MRYFLIFVLVVLFIVPSLATAQDGWETYTLVDGTTVDYPSDLQVLESDGDIIFTNKSDLQTMDSGLASFYGYTTGEFSVIFNDPSGSIGELFASEIADYSIATPEYISGVTTGLYFIVYSFASGGAFAGDDAEIPRLLVTDITQLDLDYDNQIVMMSDGTIDFYLLVLVNFAEDASIAPSVAIVTITVPTGEFSQYEEIILQMVESITLPTME